MKYANIILGVIYISGVLCLSYTDAHLDDSLYQDNEVAETQVEEQSVLSTINGEEKLAQEKTVAVEGQKVEEKAAAKSAPATSQPALTIPETDTIIYTYEDYEKTILGTCPSERDKSNDWERGNRLNSIGIITSGESKTSSMNSLKALIESWWNDYRLGKWAGRHMMASLNNISDFDKTYSNSRVAMFIDFDGLFVNWDNSWEDGKTINVSDEQRLWLNQIANDGTSYLRWLDSAYNVKCPND